MALVNCPECGKEVSTAAASCPNCGFAPKSSAAPRRQGIKKRWYFVGFVLFVIVLGAIGNANNKNGSAATALSNGSAAVDHLAQVMPVDEKDFIAAVKRGTASYRAGGTDFQKGASRPTRAHEICQVLSRMTVTGWVGKIDTLSTNGDGQGIVSVEIAPDIHVKTWNNSLSDVMDHTLVAPGTPLFQTLFALREHQNVSFSGAFFASNTDCVQEPSLTIAGSMTDPEFIFRFSQISAEGASIAAAQTR